MTSGRVCLLVVGLVIAAVSGSPLQPEKLVDDNTQPLLQPKLPETTQLGNDFNGMDTAFKQQAAEMKGDKVQRESDYSSKRTQLTAKLDSLNTHLLLARRSEEACNQRVSAFNTFNATIQGGLLWAEESKNIRNSQRVERVERGEAVIKRAQNDRERVREIARRLQLELDADPRARGRGVRFDSFVTQHDDAVKQLTVAVEKTDLLIKLLESKERHTHLARETISPVLQCEDCQKAHQTLTDFNNNHPVLVSQMASNCLQSAAGTKVEILEKRIRSVTGQLNAVNNEEAIQIKLESKRESELALQQESLVGLQKQTAQRNQTAATHE